MVPMHNPNLAIGGKDPIGFAHLSRTFIVYLVKLYYTALDSGIGCHLAPGDLIETGSSERQYRPMTTAGPDLQ